MWVLLVSGYSGVFIYFNKKLLCLLMLELCFISLIFLFFFFFSGSFGTGSYSSMMIFLGFMVMDSVLGLCCLLLSSRNSLSFMDPFFGC